MNETASKDVDNPTVVTVHEMRNKIANVHAIARKYLSGTKMTEEPDDYIKTICSIKEKEKPTTKCIECR